MIHPSRGEGSPHPIPGGGGTAADVVAERARIHAALGDEHRLAIVDALVLGDLTPAELADRLGLGSNLVAHHLGVLERAGIIRRTPSAGDGRRRYVSLDHAVLRATALSPPPPVHRVLFVCSHNSARSQLAAALWRARGREAASAGSEPAEAVHPLTFEVARRRGLDLGEAKPRGYGEVAFTADLVVSVCDRARETGVPRVAPHLHWSVPDPVLVGTIRAFEEAYLVLAERVSRLAGEPT